MKVLNLRCAQRPSLRGAGSAPTRDFESQLGRGLVTCPPAAMRRSTSCPRRRAWNVSGPPSRRRPRRRPANVAALQAAMLERRAQMMVPRTSARFRGSATHPPAKSRRAASAAEPAGGRAGLARGRVSRSSRYRAANRGEGHNQAAALASGLQASDQLRVARAASGPVVEPVTEHWCLSGTVLLAARTVVGTCSSRQTGWERRDVRLCFRGYRCFQPDAGGGQQQRAQDMAGGQRRGRAGCLGPPGCWS